MRISDWSSDVCSSDLVIAAANECPVRIAALIYDPSDIAGDGRDAPQIDSVICFDAAITRRAGIGPGERLERHFHSLISRRPGSSDRENLSWSERRVRQMRKVSVRSDARIVANREAIQDRKSKRLNSSH